MDMEDTSQKSDSVPEEAMMAANSRLADGVTAADTETVDMDSSMDKDSTDHTETTNMDSAEHIDPTNEDCSPHKDPTDKDSSVCPEPPGKDIEHRTETPMVSSGPPGPSDLRRGSSGSSQDAAMDSVECSDDDSGGGAASTGDLPDEILEHLLTYVMPYEDMQNCRQVSRRWYHAVKRVVRKLRRLLHRSLDELNVSWFHFDTPNPAGSSPLAVSHRVITKRCAHSAAMLDGRMYVFGGCSSRMTSFNDLWWLELGGLEWRRPQVVGSYPSPKAYASMVPYGDRLVLFGGWSQAAPYPIHQSWKLFDELHIYDAKECRWQEIRGVSSSGREVGLPGVPQPAERWPPRMARHAASVHGQQMVITGGLHHLNNSRFAATNEVWVFDLASEEWRHQRCSKPAPSARYGHSQVALDEHHMLLLGGSGGPNQLRQDGWLLEIGEPAAEWRWHRLTITGADSAPSQLWCHPACQVGDKVVVLGRDRSDTWSVSAAAAQPGGGHGRPAAAAAPAAGPRPAAPAIAAPAPAPAPGSAAAAAALLEAAARRTDTAYPTEDDARPPERRPLGSGVLPRGLPPGPDGPIPGRSRSFRDYACRDPDRAGRDPDRAGRDADRAGRDADRAGRDADRAGRDRDRADPESPPHVPRDLDEILNLVPLSRSRPASGPETGVFNRRYPRPEPPQRQPLQPPPPNRPSIRPNASCSRDRRLAGLLRMQHRLEAVAAERAAPRPRPRSRPPLTAGYRLVAPTGRRPLTLHVLDVSRAVTQHTVSWRQCRRQDGPDERILYSLVAARGELVMFGGIVTPPRAAEAAADLEQDQNAAFNAISFIAVPSEMFS